MVTPLAKSVPAVFLLPLLGCPAPAPDGPVHATREDPKPPSDQKRERTPERSPERPPPAEEAPRVGAEPGSGELTKVSEADKKAMANAYRSFLVAAENKDTQAMVKWTTGRLGRTLADAPPNHQERLQRALEAYYESGKSGIEVGEVRDLGGGNVDVELTFGDGKTKHVVCFREGGEWRLNRL